MRGFLAEVDIFVAGKVEELVEEFVAVNVFPQCCGPHYVILSEEREGEGLGVALRLLNVEVVGPLLFHGLTHRLAGQQ